MSDIGRDPLIPKNGGTGKSNLNASTIDLSNPVAGYVLTSNALGACTLQAPVAQGTVTSVSVVGTNGFAGTVANPTTTPAITMKTTATGVLSGNGTGISGSTVTQHGVIVGGASNAVTSTAVGTTGQVLQANTSGDPTYSTATFPSTAGTSGNVLTSDGTNWNSSPSTSSGSIVLISTQTASNSASLTFTTGITSTYTSYMVIMNGIVPGTNAVEFEMQVSTNAGVSWISTNYQGGYTFTPYNSTTFTNSTSTSFFPLSNGAGLGTSDPSVAGTLWLYDVTNGKTFKMMGNLYIFQSQSGIGVCGGYNTATSVNALKFFMSAGNITSGTISLYGIHP